MVCRYRYSTVVSIPYRAEYVVPCKVLPPQAQRLANAIEQMLDDSSRNPETDSFEYIHMILEALNKMGRLDVAVDRIEQRLPIELFAVVARTNQEVDLRHPPHLRATEQHDRSKTSVYLGRNGDEEGVLNDLLYTLYSKFEAIAEGHRAVHEIVAGIVAREGLMKTESLLGGFKELWKLYQSEVSIPIRSTSYR